MTELQLADLKRAFKYEFATHCEGVLTEGDVGGFMVQADSYNEVASKIERAAGVEDLLKAVAQDDDIISFETLMPYLWIVVGAVD